MNIPETISEPLFDILSKLSNLLNTELNEVDINKIYRIKTRNDDMNSMDKLSNLKIKTKKKKKYYRYLSLNSRVIHVTAEQNHDSCPDHKIYLNADQLSIGNR